MNPKPVYVLAMLALLVGMLSACAATPTATPTPEPTLAPPTEIPITPTATALPGKLTLPINSFAKSIPWLPLDTSKRPSVYYFAFNLDKPPFNDVLVRQAFAAAIDRDLITQIGVKYNRLNPKAATTLTPSETLGRDLYGQVGMSYDPARAKELFSQAGYTDPSSFPSVSLVVPVSTADAPGFHLKTTEAMVKMWKDILGVEVKVELLNWPKFNERISSNPPEIYSFGWAADFNDPDNFLRELFRIGAENNYGNFSDMNFEQLVNEARYKSDPAVRQAMYIEAERLLCETQAALIPMYHYQVNMP